MCVGFIFIISFLNSFSLTLDDQVIIARVLDTIGQAMVAYREDLQICSNLQEREIGCNFQFFQFSYFRVLCS